MADLGVEVTIIEVNEDILLTEIKEVRELIKDHLESQNIKVLTNSKITKVSETKVLLDNYDDVSFDTLLIATGRQPNSTIAQSLNLEMDGKFIQVDDHYQTSQPHIYAIGDLVKGYQLAHAASAHGIHVVETIADLNPLPVRPEDIARCIYTRLEAPSVGLSESQAKEAGCYTIYFSRECESNCKRGSRRVY